MSTAVDTNHSSVNLLDDDEEDEEEDLEEIDIDDDDEEDEGDEGEEDDMAEEDEEEDMGEEDSEYISDDPSSGFGSPLSAAQKAALQKMHRADPAVVELAPLPVSKKAAQDGAKLEASKIVELDQKMEALCCAVSTDQKSVAVGCRNGKVMIVNIASGEVMDVIKATSATTIQPVTSLRFRPNIPNLSTQNVLVVTQGSKVHHLHSTSGKTICSLEEQGNQINAVSIRSDGAMFATAGSDAVVRVYDETTGKMVAALTSGDGVNTAGHSNSVFGLAWKPEDYQVLVSGGWDRTVLVWDLRKQRSAMVFHNTYVCGDGVDVAGDSIVTGSWRHTNALQIWDFPTGRLRTIAPFYQKAPDACRLYCAKYGQGHASKWLAAGGSGSSPVARLYRTTGELYGTFAAASAVHSLGMTSGAEGQATLAVCSAFQLQLIRVPQ